MINNALPVQPHLYLADTLGRPLDGGKVFFGEPNKEPELYPINVFYDDALTIPAPQPIRSKGGFMNANGDMVEIYANEVRYSVKVLDSYGRQVFYQPEMVKNQDVSGGLESASDLLGVQNPTDGMTLTTNAYLAGKNKGGNTYRYNSARAAENDGGSIINGWEVVGKTALTVWDFGYEVGNQQGSKTALSKALLSKMPLQLLAETLNAHVGVGAGNDVLAQTITIDKTISGEGRDVSVIEGLRLQSASPNFVCTGFSINKNGLNYGIFVTSYDNVYIDNYNSRGNLDAVLIMGGKTPQSKALVSNCYSENSNRIGFTADVGAKNVIFQNCLSYNCRQGFHAEEDFNTTFIDCTADACGDGAMPAIPAYQPPEYAGGFRLHKYNKVTLIRCKNINKNGSNTDQLGGGGNDLTVQDCSGFRLLADVGATELYRNINIKGFKDSSIGLQLSSAKLAGDIVIHDFDGGGIELSSNTVDVANSVTSVDLKNIKASRLMLNTHNVNAIFTADNVFVRSPYFNVIKGFAHHIIGSLTYSWDNSNTDHYPNLGFKFQSTNAKSFALNTFRSIGAGSGSHLALEDMPTTTQVIIGALIGLDTVYSFSNPQELGINNASQYQTRTISLTSELLGNANLDRNKVAKYLGREVYNTTISKFMKATGSTPTSPWVSLDGATTITPS